MKSVWNKLQHAPRFKEEIQMWVAEGIITDVQAQELIRRYGLDAPPAWYRQSGWLLRGLGLLIVAAGILLLIAENWQHVPLAVQMMIGLLPLVLSYAVAWREYSMGRVQQAELAMLFATLLVGVNIWLQAQIFHIAAYYPDGILWWIISALPIIVWFQNKILHFLFTFLATIWLGIQFEYEQFSWWAFVVVGVLCYIEHVKPNTWTLVACVALSLWFLIGLMIYEARHFEHASMSHSAVVVMFASCFAMLFLLLFQLIKSRYSEHTALLFEGITTLFMAWLFYIFTFKAPLADLMRSSVLQSPPITVWAMLVMVLLMISSAIKRNKGLLPYVAAYLLIVLVCLLPYLSGKHENNSLYIYELLMNTGFVLFAITIIIIAIVITKRKGAFISGVFFLMTWILGRYVVLVEDYLTTAILFILFGGGIYYLSSWWDKRLGSAHR
ncbi:MAG: DUF2157 domain-containing protein [Cytophagales bacterium]|nr:DUF2157 domain-containing protein [Bernardetiaceae bacterium]MDW8203438.1 DUF2157 domain-containing protein [Cytophagales bacterium]